MQKIQNFIANEVDFKLRVVYTEFPALVVGFGGEAFSYSAEYVNRYIIEVFDEYNAVVDKATIHRVGRQFCDPKSKLSAMLLYKARNDVPLDHMPSLWRRIFAYCWGSVHTTANEGQHGKLAAETKKGRQSCLPGYCDARLRGGDFLKEAEEEGFQQFSRELWGNRGTREVAATLLRGLVSPARLERMTWEDKLRHLYGYDLDDMYADTSLQCHTLALHRSVVARRSAQAPVHTASERACIALFKRIFTVGGIDRVVALPRSLFELALDGKAADFQVSVVGLAALDLLEMARAMPFDNVTVALDSGHILFSVMNANPQLKVQATPSHVPRHQSAIRVMLHESLGWRGGRVATRMSRKAPLEMRISPWSKNNANSFRKRKKNALNARACSYVFFALNNRHCRPITTGVLNFFFDLVFAVVVLGEKFIIVAKFRFH